MGSLIILCKSTPPPISIFSDFSHHPIKPSLSLSKTNQPFPFKTPDFAHSNHLLKIGRVKEAIIALDSIAETGFKLKSDAFLQLLDCCIEHSSVELGHELHSRVHLVEDVCPFVETKLVSMYAKCGCLGDARKVFDEMSERNLFCWSAMIGAYSREKRWGEVVGLFGLMMKEGILPNDFLFPKILQACGNCEDFETGRLIHSLVIRSGMSSCRRVINALSAVYAKCRKMSLARRFFEEMNERDIVSWNSMISGYCRTGKNAEAHRILNMMFEEGIVPCMITWSILVTGYNQSGNCDAALELIDKMRGIGVIPNVFTWTSMISGLSQNNRVVEALELFREMFLVGVPPDDVTIASAVSACSSVEFLENGKELHSVAAKKGLCTNVLVGNTFIDMYSKCGELEAAQKVFDLMSERDVYTWNSMISGYCHTGKNVEAPRILNMMFEEGIVPSVVTWNILVTGYNQSGNCDAALELIDKMRGIGVIPDVFTWTSMISGLSQNNSVVEALELFREMFLVGVQPDDVTITSAVSACSSVEFLEKGKELHSVAAKKGLCTNVLAGNTFIDMYSKCGELEAAEKVFDLMSERDVYTWNSLVGGYCQGGYCGKAHELLMRMQKSDTSPDVVTWNIIISDYIQNGDEDLAWEIFRMMGKAGIVKPDTASWNCLISGYLHMGRKDEALMIFQRMQSSGYRPNPVTILSILPACGNLIAANKVKEIHACVLRGNLGSHISISNALIDIYGKSGNLSYLRSVFNCMSSKDIITWNLFIAGYVLHGCSIDAFGAFNLMTREGYKPNRGTFLSLKLACSRAKLVEKGKQVFMSMTQDYHIVPGSEHYAAMVDLFGCSGGLGEAIEFIRCMETEPESAIWDALLTASRSYGSIALTIHAAEHLLNLNPENGIVHHLLSQAYMASERSTNTLKERMVLGTLGLKKPLGCSLLEMNNQVYQFVSGDCCTSGLSTISSWLKSVEENIELPDSEGMHYVHEEDLEEVSGLHSEKLALASALLNTDFKVKCIRIVNNCRICEDCHCTAKYISSAYGCEIFLNDTKCLHHFKEGRCSRGDYW